MDPESTANGNHNEVCLASMDLSDFAMPSDEGSTESENNAYDGSDSSCDYEFLQTNSVTDLVQSESKIGEEIFIVNAMDMIDYESDGSDLNVKSSGKEAELSTSSGCDTSESDKSNHVLDEWHLVSQSMEKYDFSDDDSIVILEREVARPCYTFTKVDTQVDTDGHDVLMTSLVTADKHVQTTEVDSDPTLELQPPQPVEEVAFDSRIPSHKSNVKPWIIDCVFVGVLFASLVLLFYLGDYIIKAFNHPPTRPRVEETNDAVMEFMVHIVRDFNSRIEEMQRNMEYIAQNRDETVVTYKPKEINEFFKRDLASITLFFDRYREEGRRLLANNKALYQFMEIVRDNVYILNVQSLFLYSPEPSLLPKSMLMLLKAVDRITSCDLSVADDKLPVACVDGDQKVNVIFYRYDLISVNLHAEVFYHKVYQGLTPEVDAGENTPQSSVAPAESVTADNTNSGAATPDGAASFVQDCDNFSKHYRSDFCTESKSAQCGTRATGDDADAAAADIAEKTCAREKRQTHAIDVVEETGAGNRNANVDTAEAKTLKMVSEFKTLIRKFKADFENFYALCVDAAEHMEAEQNVEANTTDAEAGDQQSTEQPSLSESDETLVEENMLSSPESTSSAETANVQNEEKPAKSISGDWFFNMNEARAKLRQYYDSTVSGDWILKLGKAREKLRKRFDEYKRKFMESSSSSSKERKNKTKDEKRWSEPVTEQFKDNLKKFSTKWKSQFKRVKNGIVDNYNKYVPTSWQFDTKNKWSYS